MIVAVDDFIKDEVLLKEIADNEASIFSDPGVYYFWDGWWNSPANTVKKRLIEYVWRYHSPLYESISISGIEYWTGIQTANPDLGFKDHLVPHFDKDEELWSETKKVIGPIIGTVFYPCREIDDMEGGYLEYYEKYSPSRTLEDGSIVWPEEKPELIKPKWNRLIIFEAANLHAVTEIVSGRRRAIAINLWGHKPTEFSKEY